MYLIHESVILISSSSLITSTCSPVASKLLASSYALICVFLALISALTWLHRSEIVLLLLTKDGLSLKFLLLEVIELRVLSSNFRCYFPEISDPIDAILDNTWPLVFLVDSSWTSEVMLSWLLSSISSSFWRTDFWISHPSSELLVLESIASMLI
jgi:hypothetical protein